VIHFGSRSKTSQFAGVDGTLQWTCQDFGEEPLANLKRVALALLS
jgi:hypothetical protein